MRFDLRWHTFHGPTSALAPSYPFYVKMMLSLGPRAHFAQQVRSRGCAVHFLKKCKTCALALAWCTFLEKWVSRLGAVHIFEVRCSWPVLGPSWALLGLPWATPGSLLGPLLASLGLCWSVLASSGFSGAHFWPSLGLIRGVKTRGE